MIRKLLLHVACLCLVALVPLCDAYGTGPPIGMFPGICTSMTPAPDAVPNGHGATAQTGAAPFKVTVSQNCYKEGVPVQVVVQPLTDSSNAHYKGLFVQGRQVNSAIAVGYFSVSDSALSPLTCTGLAANSAVGHTRADLVNFRSMVWNPPASFTNNMRFSVTVVQDRTTFWVGLESSMVTYNSACTQGTTIANTNINNPNLGGTGTNLKAAPYIVPMALVSFMTAIFYR